MSSNERLKNVLGNVVGSGSRKGGARKIRSLLGRAVRTTIDALEERRLLSSAAPTANAGGPYVVNEGQSVMVDGGTSSDDVAVTGYAWDLNYKVSKGFRRSVSGQKFNFEAEDGNATRTIALRVTDADGQSDIQTTTITINDVAPVVTLTGNATAEEGQPYALSWSSTDAGTDTISGYSIDWGDGNTTTHLAGVSSATHTYAADDNYTISFTAIDEDGSHVTTKSVAVTNVAPIINASFENATVNEGQGARVNFSSPNRGDTIDQWIVDWGDNNVSVRPSSKRFATHTYADNGTYTVTVTALEADGTATDHTMTMTVNNVNPDVSLGGIADESNEGSAVTATHTTVTDAGSADTFAYAWELKKGNSVVATSTTSGNYTFTPADNGAYTLKLTVTDDDGGSVVKSKAFTVLNVAPTGTITGTVPSPMYEGGHVTFTANVSDVGSVDTHTFAWTVEKNGTQMTLPNGTVTNQATFDFAPTDEGSYVIGCLIADNDGGQYVASYSSTVTVQNVNPTATVTGGPAGSVSAIDATLSNAAFGCATDTGTAYPSYSSAGEGNGFSMVAAVMKFQIPGGTTASDVSGAVLNFMATGTSGTPEALNLYLFTSANQNLDNADFADYLGTRQLIASDVFSSSTTASVTGATLENAIKTAITNGESYISLALGYARTVGSTGPSAYIIGRPDSVTVSNRPSLVLGTVSAAGHVNEGSTQSFTATAADAGASDTLTYAWTVTKNGSPYSLSGVTTNAATLAFAPSDNGTYVATVAVSDGDGGTVSSSSSTFIVDNVAPTATLTAPTTGTEGSSLSFTVTASDVGTADTQSYAWTVTKNGGAYSVSTPTSQDLFAFTPNDNGSYVVSVVVTDDDGGSVTKTSSAVIVANAAPTATISAAPTNVFEGDIVSLTSTHADAGVNDSISYLWTVTKDGAAYSLPPGTLDTLDTFDFGVLNQGQYVVTLTVSDGLASSSTTRNVTVNNKLPVVTITGAPNTAINEGDAVSLGTSVADAGTLDTFTYEWKVLKNGNLITLPSNVNNTSDTFTFTPTDNGTYDFGVYVTDDGGVPVFAHTGTITVNNANPTATMTGAPSGNVNEGATQTFVAHPADVGADDTFSYAWSVTKDSAAYTLPSNVATNAATFAFAPNDNGDYVVTCVVSDDDTGSVSINSGHFTVDNVAPTATVAGSTTGNEGTAATFTANASDAGSADTRSYAWTVTKGGLAYTLPGGVVTNVSTLTFTPTDNGSYVATVVVTDDDNGTVTASSAADVVANVAPTVAITGATGLIGENTAVTVGTTVTDPGVNDTMTYAWTATRNGVAYDLTGVTTNAAGFTFTPKDNGTYVLSVTVTDNDGGAKTQTKTINILNVNPLAGISVEPSGSVAEGSNASYEVQGSDQGPLDTLTYAWTVTRNGATYVLPNNVVTTSANFTFAPSLVGNYVVKATVTDKDGGFASDSRTLTVTNVAPVIDSITEANGLGGTLDKGTELSYSASITDPGTENLTKTWTILHDGELFDTDTADTLDFTPTLGGTYQVKLVVSDGTSSDVELTPTFTVTNNAPVIDSMTRDGGLTEGSTLSYSAEVSDADASDTVGYFWELTLDGEVVASANTPTFSHVVPSDGNYQMSLTVSDGEDTATDSETVEVSNVAPVAHISSSTTGAYEGSTVTVVGSGTDAGNDALTYAWTIKRQGSSDVFASGTTATMNFVPTDDGVYVASLKVNDGSVDSSVVTKNITVLNDVPTGQIALPTYAGVTGWDQKFGLQETFAYSGDVVNVAWRFGDGTPAVSGQAMSTQQTHRYYTAGTYTVTATITDDDGGTTTVSKPFIVKDFGLQADPTGGNGTVLAVNGNGDNDSISFSQNSNGTIKAVRNGVTLGSAFSATRIYANGDGGANRIEANANVTVPVIFYGGSSKDTLTGGSGNDVLIGRRGIDVLNGGAGRDFLVGGVDSDFLTGGSGEDILIGGSHASTENYTQLNAIMNEWGNTSRTFAQRTARLKTGAEGLAALFASSTVIGDARADVLTGGTEADWMWKEIGTAGDSILDLTTVDRVDNVAA